MTNTQRSYPGGPMQDRDRYTDDYFADRFCNDPKRLASFRQEKALIHTHLRQGNALDVGCSTGEFIEFLRWEGSCYGMEVSDLAIKEAKTKGIHFDQDLFNSENFFDVIIYRGTIQHIETPFLFLKRSFFALKPGGFVIFLATPNANSPCYKIWNTLPFLDAPRNFFIPSDQTLKNAMINLGFHFVEVRYPYLQSPYASLWRDHLNFLLRLCGKDVKFPFWRNMMEMVFVKPNTNPLP